jgi:hypothetical protein
MYISTLGQEDQEFIEPPRDSSAETIHAVADLTRAIAEPAAQAFAIHARTELNKERLKAGLPILRPGRPLPPPPPAPKDNFVLGGIALLVIVYLLFFKS